jgi:hypothetical protein
MPVFDGNILGNYGVGSDLDEKYEMINVTSRLSREKRGESIAMCHLHFHK